MVTGSERVPGGHTGLWPFPQLPSRPSCPVPPPNDHLSPALPLPTSPVPLGQTVCPELQVHTLQRPGRQDHPVPTPGAGRFSGLLSGPGPKGSSGQSLTSAAGNPGSQSQATKDSPLLPGLRASPLPAGPANLSFLTYPHSRRLALDPEGLGPSSFPCLLPGSHTQTPSDSCPASWTPPPLALAGPLAPGLPAEWPAPPSAPQRLGLPSCSRVPLAHLLTPSCLSFLTCRVGPSTAVIWGTRAQPGRQRTPTAQRPPPSLRHRSPETEGSNRRNRSPGIPRLTAVCTRACLCRAGHGKPRPRSLCQGHHSCATETDGARPPPVAPR